LNVIHYLTHKVHVIIYLKKWSFIKYRHDTKARLQITSFCVTSVFNER